MFENHFILRFLLAPLVQIIDYIVPKSKTKWGFAVHHIKSDQFIENARAVFEEVKNDVTIKKILFTRDGSTEFYIKDAVNFELVNIKSLKGLNYLLQCGVLFVTHSISMDYSIRYGKSNFTVLKLNMDKRLVVNLWHGIPIKKLYALWNPIVRQRLDRVKFRRFERTKYAGLIASSDIDSYAMSTMFYPIKYENIWVSGLPKNDFLLKDEDKLPIYFKNQLVKIKNIKSGKRLITYAPTYRQTTAVGDSHYYQFTVDEISALKELLVKHNAVLGFRMHYFRNDLNLFNVENYIDNELIFDLGHIAFTEVAAVLRMSDLIISDYSSVFVESLYANKPILGFAYDYEHYRDHQDGLLYDFEMVFPSPLILTFDNLLLQIDQEMTTPAQIKTDKYRFAQQFFFNNIDDHNSKRVVGKVLENINL